MFPFFSGVTFDVESLLYTFVVPPPDISSLFSSGGMSKSGKGIFFFGMAVEMLSSFGTPDIGVYERKGTQRPIFSWDSSSATSLKPATIPLCSQVSKRPTSNDEQMVPGAC